MKAHLALLLPVVLVLGACGDPAPSTATPTTGTSTPSGAAPGAPTGGSSNSGGPTSGTSTPGTSTPGTSSGGSPPVPSPTPGPNPAPAPSGTLNWSDPKAWPSGAVPTEGSKVTIPASLNLVLDVSPPRLAGLTIVGSLSFAEQDLELRSDWIMLDGGKLSVGKEGAPFQHKATITLTDATPGEDVMGMGDKVLGSMMGGVLDLHGQSRLNWTRLNATAAAGATSLTLAQAPDWQPGDQIVVASTDFNADQAEVLTVRGVSGSSVTFAPALKYPHWGTVQSVAGGSVDERAEVGLLTRNVRVQGEEASSKAGFGGHIMLMDGSTGRVENVELTHMGQQGISRRYPIHFHMLGDAGANSYLRGSALHDLFNRCVTIHGTNTLRVQNNVAYNTIGHCYFLEDGAETGNLLENNLGLSTHRPDTNAGQKAVLPTDTNWPGPSTFWITNPNNTVRGNVAAGGDGVGFWYALPQHPTGLSAASGANTWPQRTPLGIFSGNVAHSYGNFGLDVDHGPKPDGTMDTTYYAPRATPTDEKSASVPAHFENFTAYKIRGQGAWFRGKALTLSRATLADNAVGATFASDQSGIEGGLVVGETANLGTPPGWESTGDGGRSLPMPWDKTFPIRGYQFYDGTVHASGVSFANFTPNSLRQASALSYLRQDAFSTSPRNFVQGLRFTNANPVYIENPKAGRDGDTSMVFVDQDGSVGGQPGAYVTANSPQLHDATCSFKDSWNSYLCPARPYGRLWLSAENASSPGTVTLSQGSRNIALVGSPDSHTYYSTTVLAGGTYGLAIQNAAPAHIRIGLNERATGETLRLDLPYPSEPNLYRDWWVDNRNKLKKVALADLDGTGGDSYAYEGGVLHLKLVVKKDLDWAELELCANDLCQ